MKPPTPQNNSACDAALATLFQAIVWKLVTPLQHPLAVFTDDGSCDHVALLAALPPEDGAKASTMADPAEQRHFTLRRCFQGLFLKAVTGWDEPIAELGLRHQTDHAPHTTRAPGLRLAFSSSGATALAGASGNSAIGLDIERHRPVSSVTSLAARFFTAREADAISSLADHHQAQAFLHCWCAKEAGLKAMGRGIVSGLNTFELDFPAGSSTPRLHHSLAETWHLHFPAMIEGHVVALVENLGSPHRIA